MRAAIFALAATAVVIVSFQTGGTLRSQTAPRPMPIVGANPQAGTLNATLWMRTSGEYRALCLQTYRMALDSLRRIKAATPENELVGKKWAVVMDLDETVLDNSLFQSGIIVRGEHFTDEAFNHWIRVNQQQVHLVPGSKEFIDAAVGMGARVHYITNRPETERAATIATLQRLGVAAGDDVSDRLQMRQGSSLKDERRAAVAKDHRVLMFVGDNLADFSDEFNPKNFANATDPLAERLNAVDSRKDKWGAEWIVLPNPVYGDWTKPISWKSPEAALLRP